MGYWFNVIYGNWRSCQEFGLYKNQCIWYHDLKYSFEHGLKPLNNDKDVLKFGEDMSSYESANICVEHVVDKPDVITEYEVRNYVEHI